MTVLIGNNIDSRAKKMTREREGQYKMIKRVTTPKRHN